MKVAAENNRHLDFMPLFIHVPACLSSRLYDTGVRNTAKKPNFSEVETCYKHERSRKEEKYCSQAAWEMGLKSEIAHLE